MKFLQRGISFLLTFCLLFPTLATARAAEIVPVSIANENVEVFVSPQNGGFAIRTVDGDVLNKDDDNKDLLYRSGDFDTSFTSLRIIEEGGATEEYIFGNNYSFLGLGGNNLNVTKDDTGISAVWTIKDITVTQRLEPVVDAASQRHGTVSISYNVANNRNKPVTVQVRVLLDTALGSQDYAYYAIPKSNAPSQIIYSECVLEGDDVPTYFESNDDEEVPSITGYSVLEVLPEITKPNKIAFGHWNNLASSAFDFTPDTGIAFVSAVNAGYKTADSAVAQYYDLGTISPSAGGSLTSFYGVRSRADFDPSQSTVDITLNGPAALTLNDAKTSYLDRSGGETGKFTVNTNLLNIAKDYEFLIMAAYTEAGIVPLDDLGNEFSEPPTRENPVRIDIVDFASGANGAREFEWNFRADVDSRSSLRRIEFRIYTPDTVGGLLLEENVVGSATMYVLCPGGDGNVERITFSSLSPDVLYTEGTRRLYAAGSGFDLLSAKTGYALRAYNTSDRSVYHNIPMGNIRFPDGDSGAMEIVLSDKMLPGTYELVFECGQELMQAGVAERLTAPALTFNLSDDPVYRNDAYGVLTVVKNDEQHAHNMKYSVVTYEKETDYDQHGAENVLLEFKGYFAKEQKDNGAVVYTSVLSGTKSTAVINQALDFSGGTITITETGSGVKIALDGKLVTNASGTLVSNGKIDITELKNGENYELICYDDFGERQDMGYAAKPIALAWASDYLGYSMFDGFPVAIRDAVFGKIFKRASGGAALGTFDGYTVSFGGSMNLKFLVPGGAPLGIDAKDVVFGRNEGLLGVNAEGSVVIPAFAKAIGDLAGTFSANTINDNYTVGVNGTIEFAELFEAEFELIVKAGESSSHVPIPDRIALYFRNFRPGQPIGPPILFITGGGGGYDELYDTIYSKGGVPPLTLDAMLQISLLQVASAEGAFKISLGGFAASVGPITLDAFPIQWGPSGEIAASWAPDLSLYARKEIDLIYGVLRGSVQIGIGEINDRFLAEIYANAFVKIPSSIILGDDITVAEAGLGVSTERIWGIAKVLGIGVGVAYYWGENDVDFSLTDLDRFKPEFQSNFQLFKTPVYQDDITGKTLMMSMGTNLLGASSMNYSGDSSISSDDSINHKLKLGADAAGGAMLTFNFDEEITEEWVKQNVSILNNGSDYVDSITFPQKDENDETNVSDATALLSSENGKSKLVVSIPPEKIVSGEWTINTVKTAKTNLLLVNPLPEIKSVNATLSGNDVTVGWSGSKLDQTTINFYIAEDAQSAGTLIGTATDPASGSETFTLPETLPSGTYYIYAIAQNNDSFSRAVTDAGIVHTNLKTPKTPDAVALTNVGNEYFRVDITGADDADGYYISVYEQLNDGTLAQTDYVNLKYEKGDDLLLGGNQKDRDGNSFGMFGGKTYVASVRGYKLLSADESIMGNSRESAPTKLNEYIPPQITFTGKDAYNTADVTFTLTSDKALTGTITVDEAESGDGYVLLNGETSKTVSLTLKDGSHKILCSAKDGDGNAVLFERLITVDTTPPVLMLSEPVNGGLFDADGTIDIKGVSEPGATYSIEVDGVALLSGQNLDGRIGDDGILSLTDLDIGSDKDVKTVKITVKDSAGNAFDQTVTLRNKALANLKRVQIRADGAVTAEKNIILKDSGDTDVGLKLFGEPDTGESFEITDPKLVSWNVMNKSGRAAVDENNTLKISADSFGYVEGVLQIGEEGAITDSLSFGNTTTMAGVYTITFVDGGTVVSTAKTSSEGKLTQEQFPTLPSKSGYAFEGWYLEEDYQTAATVDTVFAAEASCYAKWRATLSPSSGVSGTVYRTITATAGAGGTISPSGDALVALNSSKTFTILPNAGYEVADVTVNGRSVGAVLSYKFENITEAATIHATFKAVQGGQDWSNPFIDVKQDDWYYDSVRYVYENGLFSGTSENTFEPNATMTRAMLVTVLWRAAGEPEPTGSAAFTDLEAGAYYQKAVDWAAENGIINGYTAELFAPNNDITREQIAAIIKLFADYKGIETGDKGDLAAFADAGDVSEWAVSYMEWAVGFGLISGRDDNRLDPRGSATRAEVALILQRFLERIG